MTLEAKDGSAEDYRQIHLERGETYDANLATFPFDAYMAEWERKHLRAIIPTLFQGQPVRYLDFACGTGRITETVMPFCAESVGVDISASMLAEAKAKCPTAQFVEADLTSSNVELGSFDLMTSFRFFGNAQQELRLAVLRALHRLLKPRGYLIINSHRNPHALASLINALGGGDNEGIDLSYFKLKRLLGNCGFEIVETRPIGVWMYRHKLQLSNDANSEHAIRMESRFKHPILTPIAPDAVVVARKIG